MLIVWKLTGKIIFDGTEYVDSYGYTIWVYNKNSKLWKEGWTIQLKKDDCLQDVLQNGENGFSFETQEEFLEGLEAVLYGPERAVYSGNARRAVLPYSKEAYAERIERIYQRK